MNGPARYFFVHLQKTAGTALFGRLRHHFGREAIYPLVDDERTIEGSMSIELLQRRWAERADQFQIVTGHFPLCVTDMLGAQFSTFTVLRDPIDRTLSFLRDNKSRDPRHRHMSLEEIYENPVLFHGLINNHMVKMLSLTPEETTNWAMTLVDFDRPRLERAKRNLAERIDVVGLQEDFDQFCTELERRFGFDLGPTVVANRTAPMKVSDELRERIARDNLLDVELYQFAQGLVKERRPSTDWSVG